MSIDLSGVWKVRLGEKEAEIRLPGTVQNAGLGEEITIDTPWVSGLHNPLWYEREEYKYGQENGCKVPFLSQPKSHYTGLAVYEKEIEITEDGREWFLYMELARWHSTLYVDDKYVGEDESLCTAHQIWIGALSAGKHGFRIVLDTTMQHPYRPDGHGVTDALCNNWNGVVGEFLLLTAEEVQARKAAKLEYAKAHPRHICIENGKFMVDGRAEYFRGTHFGGDYPLTGHPETDIAWWEKLMDTVKSYGLNFIRCHSYCPPEAAFLAADRAGVYLQPECGMWNIFEEGNGMMPVLEKETVRILEQFGHHPSFVLFSPSNEPGGQWYGPLEKWVDFAREADEALGYEKRRVYTAQSGWFFDVPPAEITGTDYIYFHRSAYGPLWGGTIRNYLGWKGKDYSPSVEGATKPIISHEMGQWCAYPDFDVMEKFTGAVVPGNYEVFRENAKAMGVYPHHKDFCQVSGKHQVRLLKEEVEANMRTKELYGYEILDLHDYLGQGTALVGILDAFWESKGYAAPEEISEFISPVVLLARLLKYVYHSKEKISVPIEVANFGEMDINGQVVWRIYETATGKEVKTGILPATYIKQGENTSLGMLELDFGDVAAQKCRLTIELQLEGYCNHWDLYVYEDAGEYTPYTYATSHWEEAKAWLSEGKTVVFTPRLSELDYECPPTSIKNAFWNAQMGPDWGRNLGLSIDKEHPIFQDFATEHHGGWQWEDILATARGFCVDKLSPDVEPIVRVVDDWNRNLPLALMLEGKVGNGHLILVSADLEGHFKERPAACTLKQAIMKYAWEMSKKENKQLPFILAEHIEAHLFPLYATTNALSYGECKDGDGKEFSGELPRLWNVNPGEAFHIKDITFPVSITMELKEEMGVSGMMYMPEQRDRMHLGCVKEYLVEGYLNGGWKVLTRGFFKNGLFSQRVEFEKVKLKKIRFTILSCHNLQARPVWEEDKNGWHPANKEMVPQIQMGALHLIFAENVNNDGEELFWSEHQKSKTKEIDN
ncbi:MAG: hypothetical protein IJZ82_07845 [Lachnospiraceae bacterium]|nr:hypothetical protein [Lachnospiraceae bacterium]